MRKRSLAMICTIAVMTGSLAMNVSAEERPVIGIAMSTQNTSATVKRCRVSLQKN